MASISMTMKLTSANQNRLLSGQPRGGERRAARPVRRAAVQASLKERALAAVLTASAVIIPQAAEAAGPGISPSLNNFLLSITAGGVVLAAIFGAVVGVSNFDPVKRT